MHFSNYQHRLSQLKARLNLMVCLVFGLLLTNILLSMLVWYTSVHQKILVTPYAQSSGFSHSDASPDPKYIDMMSENFIYSRLNVTPETIYHNQKRLLMYVDGSYYAAMQHTLAQEASAIQKNAISSHFLITNIHQDLAALSVTITGILERAVGGRALPSAQMTYVLHYRFQLGRLSIIGFTKTQEKDHV